MERLATTGKINWKKVEEGGEKNILMASKDECRVELQKCCVACEVDEHKRP